MILLEEPTHPKQQELKKEQYENCVIYNMSKQITKKRGERNLFLTIHFQKAQFPPIQTGKKPLFDYQLTQVRVLVELYNAKMPIDNIRLTSSFPLESDFTIKQTISGESSNLASGKIDSEAKLEISATLENKEIKSLGKEFKQINTNIEFKHFSDTNFQWNFKSHNMDRALKGTLTNKEIGCLVDCKSGSQVKSYLYIFEKDIIAAPPENLIKLGIIGFVKFKLKKTNIVKSINENSKQVLVL